MLDLLNQHLIDRNEEPVTFDHDCREGICGMCGLVINGIAHGPKAAITTCQLHMRVFKDGDTITVEPWRSKAFPIIKDLIVDREAFDRIVAGGRLHLRQHRSRRRTPTPSRCAKEQADRSMDAAACIGCGACVAACPNSSAMLFTSAKLAHLNALPQGQAERFDRSVLMVEQMDKEGFGGCTNYGRVRGRLPEGDQPGLHRRHEPRPAGGNMMGKGKR
jgi:succinate dehydrogenase / fumarate reductase iron-sulfur subunit